jgi:hypothetical protein
MAPGPWTVPVASLVAVAVTGCTGEVAPTRAEIEAFLGMMLPAEMQGFAANAERGIDTLIRARFLLPEAEAKAFAQALIGQPLVPGHDPGIAAAGHGLPDWPEALPPGAAGAQRDDWPRGRTYRLLSVPAGPGWRRLYLIAFTV